MAVCVWFQLSHQGDRAPTQAAPSLPTRKVTVYKIIFCKKGKKKLHLKKSLKRKKKTKNYIFYYRKKVFFSPPVLNGKEEKLTICTEMFLLWHRKITKHKVIFHSFYWIFFLLPVPSAVFISLISCPLGGGVGGYSCQRHTGACVFARSLVHENILWY